MLIILAIGCHYRKSLKMKNDKELISEFGSSMPIRFATAKFYDKNHKEILCACGKSSAITVCSINSYITMCTECHEKLISKDEMD